MGRQVLGKRALVSICAGIVLSAMALSIMFGSTASAQTTGKATETRQRADVPSDVVVKEMHITLLKFALNLRPAQEPFWAPVEAALHDMVLWQAKVSSEFDSSGRAGSAVMLRLKRIAALAVPLIRALDENQRRSMMMLARSAGLEMLLASK
jgi:hypothetical protein